MIRWSVVLPFAALLSGSDSQFEMRIRPLLAVKCFSCHAETKMGGLRLDSREAMLTGGGRGAAVLPGDSGASLLIRAVKREDKALRMPPTEALTSAEVAALAKWIDDGAEWPQTKAIAASPPRQKHWAFQPVSRPEVPAGINAVDFFLSAAMKKAGVKPAGAADKRTLIRRATLELTGLPPTPEEVSAFLADKSADAFAKVVDRLLASPHYGERMARRWLDLARYADGRSAAQRDDPLPNAWRYRDWVVQAFNEDMPYDRFVKAQLAADLMGEKELLPALGFHALLDREDDRVDITGRALLGLTVGCAQCHDHKYDPIPQSDYYSLQGVFDSTEVHEFPLAPAARVKAYKEAKERAEAQKLKIDVFLEKQSEQLALVLMERTADYLVAAWTMKTGGASEESLDGEVLKRWVRYLGEGEREHPYLDEWLAFMDRGGTKEDARAAAEKFERTLFAIRDEKRDLDDRNYVKLGGAKGVRDQRVLLNTNLEFLDPLKYYLWREMAEPAKRREGVEHPAGIYYFGAKEIERFLSGVWLDYLQREREELARLEKAVPAQYPFLHAYRDAQKPKDARILIRGEKSNPGEPAPRRFLRALSDGEPELFTNGSGRLELASKIVSKENPLTARVMVNRLWQWRFGRGLVGSASNFGRNGELPSHPELLDWLASELTESGWSLKALERKIVLSDAYRRSSAVVEENQAKDAGNELLWRFPPVERLDAETLRDSMLAVSGTLDGRIGGPPRPLTGNNRRRALYGTVMRTSPDRTMTLFDFPDPKGHAEERSVTLGPLQRLYFLNNPFVMEQAEALAERVRAEAGEGDKERIARAYELVYSRPPAAKETAAGLEFLRGETWPRYAQMLLASSEFLTVR